MSGSSNNSKNLTKNKHPPARQTEVDGIGNRQRQPGGQGASRHDMNNTEEAVRAGAVLLRKLYDNDVRALALITHAEAEYLDHGETREMLHLLRTTINLIEELTRKIEA